MKRCCWAEEEFLAQMVPVQGKKQQVKRLGEMHPGGSLWKMNPQWNFTPLGTTDSRCNSLY
ncbi:MAG: hypothetical protein ACK53Y_21630, partial [bacterium]